MNRKIFTASAWMHQCSPSRFSFCRLAPWIFLALVALMVLIGCGEDVPTADREIAARALAATLLAVQTAPDSVAARHAADSAARTYGYDDWSELTEHLSHISLFPDDFRPMLDSAQRILERAAAADTTTSRDTLLPELDTTASGLDSTVQSILSRRGKGINAARPTKRTN